MEDVRRITRHPLTNLSAAAAVASYCAQNYLSDWLNVERVEVSWGWLAVVFAAIWFGAQLRQFENGDHWLQELIARRKIFAEFTPTRKVKLADGYAYYADVVFARYVENVVIKVEVFRFNSTMQGHVWRRVYKIDALSRANCNKGLHESIKLIELRREKPVPPPAPPPTPLTLADLAKGVGVSEMVDQIIKSPVAPDEVKYRVRLTVTAAKVEPCSREYDMWSLGNELHSEPFEDHDAPYVGDASYFAEKEAVLWVKS